MKTTIIPKPLVKLTLHNNDNVLIKIELINLVEVTSLGTKIRLKNNEIYYVKETVEEVYELCQPKIICEDPNFIKK